MLKWEFNMGQNCYLVCDTFAIFTFFSDRVNKKHSEFCCKSLKLSSNHNCWSSNIFFQNFISYHWVGYLFPSHFFLVCHESENWVICRGTQPHDYVQRSVWILNSKSAFYIGQIPATWTCWVNETNSYFNSGLNSDEIRKEDYVRNKYIWALRNSYLSGCRQRIRSMTVSWLRNHIALQPSKTSCHLDLYKCNLPWV